MSARAHILIVDDIEANRMLLADSMFALGHDPDVAENGHAALEKMRRRQPDLVLLDILMPVMDGCETLKQIKADDQLRHTPVLVISAVDEMDNVLRCIAAGAEDYLVKPFNAPLLKARITACLERKELHDQEEQHRAELKEAYEQIQAKNAELIETNALKDKFLQIANHDIRNPLTVLSSCMYSLRRQMYETMKPEQQEFFDAMQRAAQRMGAIVDNFLDYKTIQEGRCSLVFEPVNLNVMLNNIVHESQEYAAGKNVILRFNPCDASCTCKGDSSRLEQVVSNYLSNALKFTPAGSEVSVQTRVSGDMCHVAVHDAGPGIEESERDRLFQEFARFSSIPTGNEKSTGLGLSIVKHLVQMHGGSVGARFPDEGGSQFWFSVPCWK